MVPLPWVLLQASLFVTGFLLQQTNKDLSNLNRVGASVFTSRGAGLCLAVTVPLIILPLCRHTFTLALKIKYLSNIVRVLGVHKISFHKLAAQTTAFWAIIHAVCHCVNLYKFDVLLGKAPVEFLHFHTYAGLSGHLMVLSLLVIFFTSVRFMRREYYNIFYLIHHTFIMFYIAFIFHGVGCVVKTNNGVCMPYYSTYFASITLTIYIIERLSREFRPFVYLKGYELIDEKLFKIHIPGKKFINSQSVLIKCPAINPYEWHAFTISSSSSELSRDSYEITIKVCGDWTKQLHELLKVNESLILQVDGPFWSEAETTTYKESGNIILFASGIGITPFLSIINDMYSDFLIKDKDIKYIKLVWVTNDHEFVRWFIQHDKYKLIPKNILDINIYLTGNITLPGTHQGRPNISEIVREHDSKMTSQTVCYTCCNDSMYDDILAATSKYDKKFKVINEEFVK